METFTRSETSISTASFCPLQLLAMSNSALVFGGVCWISLSIFRGDVCVPMSKCTFGGRVPMLCHRTGKLLWLSPCWALAPNAAVWRAFFFFPPEALIFVCWCFYYSWDLSSPLHVLWWNSPCTFLHLHLLLHFHPDPLSAKRFSTEEIKPGCPGNCKVTGWSGNTTAWWWISLRSTFYCI